MAATTATTVSQLVNAVRDASGGRLAAMIVGADAAVRSVAPLESATSDQLSFLANPRYRAAAAASAAGAIVLSEADHAALGDGATRTWIVCAYPYAWFAFAAQQLAPASITVAAIAPSAVIDPSARLGRNVRIDPHAVIEPDAELADDVWIGAGAVVGAGASVGAATRLHPGARLLHSCRIGARGVVHAGAVIGADGFGFAPFEGRYIKIPQTGRVQIGDDVEIGANTTIDRGTMGDTVIEDGVKIDNQVQIGHNCRIGAHTVIAGCVGIAGSATVGRGCQLGGAAMILGHLSIADGTVVSSGTLVSRSITAAGFFTGFFPLMSNRDWERNAAVLRQLAELRDRVRRLERGHRRHNDNDDDALDDGKNDTA